MALGWREAVVVLVAVPVTLALTLLVYRLYGYTLNRITLFALVFAIGILVDDAIVVVENIARHLGLKQRPPDEAAVLAVDEVGNPTILATFTVIAAILPMAFVSGLMGPYMEPIPVGASVAMLFSLAVAFVVTPYLAVQRSRKAQKRILQLAAGPDHKPRHQQGVEPPRRNASRAIDDPDEEDRHKQRQDAGRPERKLREKRKAHTQKSGEVIVGGKLARQRPGTKRR